MPLAAVYPIHDFEHDPAGWPENYPWSCVESNTETHKSDDADHPRFVAACWAILMLRNEVVELRERVAELEADR
jgi:hypothetical protein